MLQRLCSLLIGWVCLIAFGISHCFCLLRGFWGQKDPTFAVNANLFLTCGSKVKPSLSLFHQATLSIFYGQQILRCKGIMPTREKTDFSAFFNFLLRCAKKERVFFYPISTIYVKKIATICLTRKKSWPQFFFPNLRQGAARNPSGPVDHRIYWVLPYTPIDNSFKWLFIHCQTHSRPASQVLRTNVAPICFYPAPSG